MWVELIALFYVWNDVFGLEYIHTELNKVFRLGYLYLFVGLFLGYAQIHSKSLAKILPEVTIFFFPSNEWTSVIISVAGFVFDV